MHPPTAHPAIWVHTTLPSFNLPASNPLLSFLTDEQQARLERLRQSRMLFDGRHREYFLDEDRTQFDFPRVRAGSLVVQLYLTYNVLGLISLKAADLLFGQAPILRAADEHQQRALDALVERSALHPLLYSCAVDASYEGECFLETVARTGRTYLVQVPADEIFPLGSRGPDGQYDHYVRYRLKNLGTTEEPVYLLLEVLYSPGRIERRCFQLDEEGRRSEIGLSAWTGTKAPRHEGTKGEPGGPENPSCLRASVPPCLSPLTLTGLDTPTITWLPNLLVRGQPVSDYDGAIELQDALNAKNSQVGRVLLKHSDPRMAFPEEAFDPQTGSIRADHDVFAYGPDSNRVPRYITWDAELQHAMADRSFVLNQLLVRTETSQVLLGMKQGAAPDAYKKVRLEAFNSLTKAARKASYWKSAIRRAVELAQRLENRLSSGPRYPVTPVGVQLRDGIPVDEQEQAQRLATLRGAGLISVERAVEEQLLDAGAVKNEIARLARHTPQPETP
ncbi:MAG TPA: phage portal protein [Blastocatellia bacterium]|nr:phage portal protein [Blastocatellia bacterium]